MRRWLFLSTCFFLALYSLHLFALLCNFSGFVLLRVALSCISFALRCVELHCIAVLCIAFRYIALRCVALHYLALLCLPVGRFTFCFLFPLFHYFIQVRISEQERIIGELGRGLQQAEMKGDRRLVEYQKKYEQRIQFLMTKLRDAESNEAPDERITYVEVATQIDRRPFL